MKIFTSNLWGIGLKCLSTLRVTRSNVNVTWRQNAFLVAEITFSEISQELADKFVLTRQAHTYYYVKWPLCHSNPDAKGQGHARPKLDLEDWKHQSRPQGLE